ncbi:DUF3378 domain-containing protein, partial [Bacillus paralicheniformis]|uniref:DUF3378 domain-containing protein n=1 Tax=Bacillus paralicheniformis TaxID=1648923 RepID=UPI002DB7A535
MSHSVLKVPPSVIERMQSHYGPHMTSLSVQGAVFQAKPQGCTITAYRSGKVLFQGKNAEKEAERWTADAETPAAKKPASKKSIPSVYQPPEGIGSMSVICSDEVGTGDYFGPITV